MAFFLLKLTMAFQRDWIITWMPTINLWKQVGRGRAYTWSIVSLLWTLNTVRRHTPANFMTNDTNTCSFQTHRDGAVSTGGGGERLRIYSATPSSLILPHLLSYKPHNGVYCPGSLPLIAQSRVPPTGDDELVFRINEQVQTLRTFSHRHCAQTDSVTASGSGRRRRFSAAFGCVCSLFLHLPLRLCVRASERSGFDSLREERQVMSPW